MEFPSGEKDDMLETLYTNMENSFWACLDRIRTSTRATPVDIVDKMHLFRFLLFLHWRLPSNIPLSDRLAATAFNDDENEDTYFAVTGKDVTPVPNEFREILRTSPVFKKFIKLIAPSAPFHKDAHWFQILNNWRFLYTGDSNQWYIVGDNPLITKGYHDHHPMRCLDEFVFPISGDVLLINTPALPKTELPPRFVFLYGAAIFQRSTRFVAASDEVLLKHAASLYKEYVKYSATHIIIPDLFKILETAWDGKYA